MPNINLDQFIKNLKELQKAPIPVFNDAIIDFTYAVLWQMAKHTIIDTGQARAKIIKKFAEKYNLKYSDLEGKFLRYWEKNGYPENMSRDWNNYSSTQIKENKSKKNKKINVVIDDEGLYAQAYASSDGNFNGKQYPSPNPYDEDTGEYRDNSDFFPRHIDIIIDNMNNGSYGAFEKLDYDKIVNEIVNNIETFLFKK